MSRVPASPPRIDPACGGVADTQIHHRTCTTELVAGLVFLLAAGLVLVGCDRAPATSAGQPVTPGAQPLPPASGGNGATPAGAPTREDVAGFLRGALPAEFEVRELQNDVPQPDPDERGAWLLNAKVVLAPREDLLRPATEEERRELDGFTERFNQVATWRKGFWSTVYAREMGLTDLPVTAPTTRPLLVLALRAGTPLPASYLKLQAERQVDRWRFYLLPGSDLRGGGTITDQGERRGRYDAAALVLGSPEATAQLDSVRKAAAAAEAWKAGLERDYAARLVEATRPGMTYTGRTQRGNIPVLVRFGERPSTGGKETTASYVVTLPEDPLYRFSFRVAVATIPPADSGHEYNLTARFTDGVGKPIEEGPIPFRKDKSAPTQQAFALRNLQREAREPVYLKLVPGHDLEGTLAPGYLFSASPKGQ